MVLSDMIESQDNFAAHNPAGWNGSWQTVNKATHDKFYTPVGFLTICSVFIALKKVP
jgi:hypothetical protein